MDAARAAHEARGLLDVAGFWAPPVALARHLAREGYVREGDLGSIVVGEDADGLLDALGRGLARGRLEVRLLRSRQ